MPAFEAFISYRHGRVSTFAARLEQALKSYGKPLLQRPRRIFRDEKHFSVGIDLPKLIEQALRDSKFLILLASPEAALSPWVQDELRIWLTRPQRLERLIVVLTAGRIEAAAGRTGIDWSATDALPAWLSEHIESVPLYIDARPFVEDEQVDLHHPAFRSLVNRVVAAFRGIDPNEMLGEEVRQHRRNLRLRNGAVALLAGFAGVAAMATVAAMASREVAYQRLYQNALRLARDSLAGPRPPSAFKALDEVAQDRRDWLWDLSRRSVAQEARIFEGHTYWALAVEPGNGPDELLSGGGDNAVRIWSWRDRVVQKRELMPGVSRVWRIFRSRASGWTYAFGEEGGVLYDADWKVLARMSALECGSMPPFAAFRPDGRQVVLRGSHDTCIADYEDGKFRFRKLPFIATHIAYTGDGSTLVLTDTRRQKLHWYSSARPLEQGRTIPLPDIVSVAPYSGARGLVVALEDGLIQVWRDKLDERPFVIKSRRKLVRAGANASAGIVWSLDKDGHAVAWDAKSGDLLAEMHGEPVEAAGCVDSPGGIYLACHSGTSTDVSRAPTIYLWRMAPPYYQRRLRGHTDGITQLKFIDDDWLASTSNDGTVRIWRADDDALIARVAPERTMPARLAVAVAPDGSGMLVLASGIVRRWRREGWEFDATTQAPNAEFVALAEDGSTAVLGASQRLIIWNMRTGAKKEVDLPAEFPTAAAFRPGTRQIALAVSEGEVRLLEPDGTSASWTARLAQRIIRDLRFTDDGRRLLAAVDDGTVRLLDASNGAQILKLDVGKYFGIDTPVHFARFDACEKRILVGTALSGASVWDAQTGAMLTSFPDHGVRTWVTGGAFVDRRTAATIGLDGAVRFWDAASGEELAKVPIWWSRFPEEVPKLEANRASTRFAITRRDHVDVLKVAESAPARECGPGWRDRLFGALLR